MRGTIHFVAPENARWMLRLSAARMVAADRRRQSNLGLDEAILERSKQIFIDELSGGRRLTRAELLSRLERAGIAVNSQRGYHILWYTAQTGTICMGPMQKKEQTFVLLDEWAPPVGEPTREEALVRLARLYFTSHAPSTLRDFAWWAGLTLRDARLGVDAIESELEPETSTGILHWRQVNAASRPASDQPDLWLLPGFDEFMLGYSQRNAILSPDHADRVVPGGNGIFRPIVVIGGQVQGTWKRSLKKNGVEITVEPFASLNGLQDALEQEAQRYCRFLQLPLANLHVETSA